MSLEENPCSDLVEDEVAMEEVVVDGGRKKIVGELK